VKKQKGKVGGGREKKKGLIIKVGDLAGQKKKKPGKKPNAKKREKQGPKGRDRSRHGGGRISKRRHIRKKTRAQR